MPCRCSRSCGGIHGRATRRTRRNRLVGLSSGLLLAADLSLWHEAILRIGAGLATVLVNVQVVFVASLAWLLYGEQPSRSALVTVPFILVGVALVSGLGEGDAYGRDPVGGVVFGVLAGAAYAAYLLAFRTAQPPAAPAAGPLMEASLGAALGTSLVGPFVDPGFTWSVPLESHVWLLALGLLAQVAGWLLIGSALPRLPALETSVMLLAQPIATMLWGVVVFGEGASRTQMAGVPLTAHHESLRIVSSGSTR